MFNRSSTYWTIPLGQQRRGTINATLLIFEKFKDVEEKAKQGKYLGAKVASVMGRRRMVLRRPALPEKITLKVFKCRGNQY